MKKLFSIILCLTTVFALTACGTKTNKQEDAKIDGTTQVEDEVDVEEDVTEAETRIIADLTGEVEIPANPQKIVDLTGSSDILSILGYKVIATANSDAYDYTKFPTYLEETLKDAKIVGYSMQDTMDIEAIISTEPDLIIISSVQEKMYDVLKEIAPTIMIEMAQINWKDDIKALATLFDREDIAAKWLNAYETQAIETGHAIKEKLGEDTTYMSFLASGGQFYIFSKAGLGDVLSTDMGLAVPEKMPVQSDISLPVVNYEGLAEIDADYVIVVATDEDLAELENNSVWTNLRAVKENHVIILPTSPYFNQGYSSIGRELLLDELKSNLLALE